MDANKKQRIALEVIKVLKTRFDSFPTDVQLVRNAPFHKAFLKAFSAKISESGIDTNKLITLNSWIHGLNTTLGQSFFENVANILCDGDKRKFSGEKIYEMQAKQISEIMTDLKNGIEEPNVERENHLLDSNNYGDLIDAQAFTADCFFVEQDRVVAIELKSVRPNSGEMRGEKQKILVGKAVLKRLYPDKDVYYYFGFPFDPLSREETGYDKEAFMNSIIEFKKFCAKDELLIADELWSFLSGEYNTMQRILDIIKSISTESFIEDFEFLNNPNKILEDPDRYLYIADKWCLEGEKTIAENLDVLMRQAESSNSLYKALNKNIFNYKGEYNYNRANTLLTKIFE